MCLSLQLNQQEKTETWFKTCSIAGMAKNAPPTIRKATLIPSAECINLKILALKCKRTKHVSLSTPHHSPKAKSGSYGNSSIYRKKAIWQPLYKRLTPNAVMACSCGRLPLYSHLQVAYCHGSIRQRKHHAPQSNFSHVVHSHTFFRWYTLCLACDAQQAAIWIKI